jgi:hypothetical protein
MGRFATGLILLALILPPAVHATTAPSLSDRIRIDGAVAEYAHDEWVLDATTIPPEPGHDSRRGGDGELIRLAVTWDREFLYVAAEFRARDAYLALWAAGRAGGLLTLENAGEFRRAVSLTDFAPNILVLAGPSRPPRVTRADDAHPFALVDRAAIPAAVSVAIDGGAGFEMAIPWSALPPSRPVRLIAAITGAEGEGAADAAPDPSAALPASSFERAVLDRSLRLVADADKDGVADVGIAPRAAVVVEPDAATAQPRDDASLSIHVAPRAFAPDRGERAELAFVAEGAAEVWATCAVYSIDGTRVRTLFADAPREVVGGAIVPAPEDRWDGRDDRGDIVRGGAYIVWLEWGLARGERAGRATAPVVVVR